MHLPHTGVVSTDPPGANSFLFLGAAIAGADPRGSCTGGNAMLLARDEKAPRCVDCSALRSCCTVCWLGDVSSDPPASTGLVLFCVKGACKEAALPTAPPFHEGSAVSARATWSAGFLARCLRVGFESGDSEGRAFSRLSPRPTRRASRAAVASRSCCFIPANAWSAACSCACWCATFASAATRLASSTLRRAAKSADSAVRRAASTSACWAAASSSDLRRVNCAPLSARASAAEPSCSRSSSC